MTNSFLVRIAGYLFLGGILISLFISCEDIFEKDLEGKEVVIISPADSLQTQYTTQNFWWEKTDGALTYNLQIASPSFNSIEKLVIDTNISATKFVYTLYPGKFQWRIRPANGSSQGNYVVRSLEIDTTLDLRGQEVVLKNPADEFATREDIVLFSWNKLYNAEDYRFELKAKEWTGNRVISPVLTQFDTLSVWSLAEGIYWWGVQGQNNGSATLYSTRKFYVDRTAPKAPVLAEPADSTKTDKWPVVLKWASSPDAGSSIYDSVVVASDNAFRSVKLSKRVDSQTESVTLNTDGKYYWKVISVDAAGNVSPSSEVNLFIVGNTSISNP